MHTLSETLPLPRATVGATAGRALHSPDSRLNPLALEQWDAHLVAHPEATVFHTAAWARVLHETYGHTPFYLGRLEAGRCHDLLPIMEVASALIGRRGVSLPFTDFCEPLATGENAAARNWELALRLGRERGWKYFESRGLGGVPADAYPALTFFGHELDLELPEDRLFAGLAPGVRRAIRKAQTEPLEIEIKTDLAAVQAYYALHCRTRQWHGVPPQPFRFFANLHRHLLARGLGWVIQARCRDRIVASAIFFQFGRRAVYKFGASDRRFQSFRPNNLLLWEAIKWHAAHGFASLHFGRTSLANEGLRRFKLGFGAREECLEYFRYDFRRDGFVTTPDRAEGWLNALFRRLPLPLLRFLGAALYPHLS